MDCHNCLPAPLDRRTGAEQVSKDSKYIDIDVRILYNEEQFSSVVLRNGTEVRKELGG
jgi:hypothetical protein